MVLDDLFFLLQLHSLMCVALLDYFLEFFSASVQLFCSKVENLLLFALVPEANLLHECLRSKVIRDFYKITS